MTSWLRADEKISSDKNLHLRYPHTYPNVDRRIAFRAFILTGEGFLMEARSGKYTHRLINYTDLLYCIDIRSRSKIDIM